MSNQKNTHENNMPRSGAGDGTSARTAREPDTTSTGASSGPTDGIETAVDKAKDTGKTLLSQAKSTASDAYESVANKAVATIEEQKSGFTGGLSSVAETVRRVSGVISEGESQTGVSEYAARYTETAAQKLDEAATYFESTDLRGLARDVEVYARRNPAIFLGAAFALGVLAARFIKSPSPSITRAGASTGLQLPSGGSDSRFEAHAGGL